MNWSWSNNSNNSSNGFVYFNNSQSLDTSDFLSFTSDSSSANSPSAQQFQPSNFSSPRKPNFYGKSARDRVGRNFYYTPHKRSEGKSWRKNGGLTSPADKVTSPNNYHNNYQRNNYRKQNRGRHSQSNNVNESLSMSVFYDPTCLEDPWQELEEKLVEKRFSSSVSLYKTNQSVDLNMEKEETSLIDEEGDESEDNSDEMQQSFS